LLLPPYCRRLFRTDRGAETEGAVVPVGTVESSSPGILRAATRGAGETVVLFGPGDLDADVYSLNVPIPGEVSALATDLGRRLSGARVRPRGEHTLVCKRLTGNGTYHEREARAREALAGTEPFEARITATGWFETAVTGSSPVVYLAVESPGLVALHRRLCEAFEPLGGIEGDDYVPHVTVARDGPVERARQFRGRRVNPVAWTVTDLVFRDAERGQSVSRVSLPA
jgi:2'-5' RNA ligase